MELGKWIVFFTVPPTTYNVNIHALPPAWQVVDARIVAEDVHGPSKLLLTPIVQGHEISPLRDVTAANISSNISHIPVS